MFIRCRTILFVVCVFVTLIQNEADAKPFLEYFYDSLKFQHNSYHKPHHHHAVAPAAPEPVGGKERFKQICNVIRGISDCYAWQMTHWNEAKKKQRHRASIHHTQLPPLKFQNIILIDIKPISRHEKNKNKTYINMDSNKNEWKGKRKKK